MIDVVHCDEALLSAALDDVPALAARLRAAVPDGLIDDEFRQSFRYSLDELRKRPSELDGWWTVLFVLREPRVVCGAGGFRGPPSSGGMVEIGYSIVPSLRGRGLATAAAGELVRHAFSDPRTATVQAHTLSQVNPSTRVLDKLGFVKVAEYLNPAEHPEPVWRWELRRP
ncbi:MAG TPA: GNAT family N-acetyltransferase [Myxococcales bacterium]|nr:GNAT family N-acetyltransferase [Myxococcales bacterium]